MRIAVCVKSILDPDARVQVASGGRSLEQLEPRSLRMLNPADRTAFTLASGFADMIPDCTITAVTLDDETSEPYLRSCAAVHASRLVRVRSESIRASFDALATAEILASYFREFPVDIIFCGEESLDEGSATVGPALAEFLNWPFVANIHKAKWHAPSKRVHALSHLGHGLMAEISAPLPVLLIVSPGNFPYISINRRRQVLEEPITRTEPAGPESLRSKTCVKEFADPRPRVRRSQIPDAGLPAAERIRQLVGGGESPGKPNTSTSRIVEGNAASLANVLFQFLKENGFLT